jgi:hypothetical protein
LWGGLEERLKKPMMMLCVCVCVCDFFCEGGLLGLI